MEYAAQTHSAYNITQVQEEVQSRVSALKSHVLEWLEILQHIIRGITSEVQFLLSFIGATLRDLCRAWNRQRGASGPGTGLNHDSSSTSGARGNDARAGQSTIGAGGSLGSGRYSQASVMREVGHILVQFLLKNLLFFPKYFGLLASDYTITGRHSSNLKRLVQVVDRVVGGRLYDTSAQPWMQPLNSIIVAQSNQVCPVAVFEPIAWRYFALCVAGAHFVAGNILRANCLQDCIGNSIGTVTRLSDKRPAEIAETARV